SARACAVASLLLAGFACHAARPGGTTPATTGFVARTTTVDGMLYRYQVFVPRGTDRGARPPVILSLHGAGERGTDGQLQTMVGLGPVVRGRAESFPAVVVMPQAPSDSVWSGAPARAAMQALDAALRRVGAPVRYTEYAGVGHNSWESAYNEPELWRWLWAQHLARRVAPSP